jgi:hypothetical protein
MGQGNKSRRKGGSGSHGHTGTKKNRGPRHGHGNRGKRGGGNAYGTNNINMTISQAKKIYANQLAAGYSLQEAMKHNKAETVSFHDLLDDKGDTKQSNSNTPNNSTNNNTMTVSDADWLNQQYLSKFGRTADTTSAGGAKYWLDQMAANPTSHSRDEVARMLGASAEGTSYANDGVVRLGGVDRGASTVSQADNEYLKSISHLGLNNANVLNTIAGNTYLAGSDGAATTDNVAGGYFQLADNDITLPTPPPGGDDDATVAPAPGGWWSDFDDADAFKDFLKGDDDGMDDFMKFMMLMSVMKGGGGMGGGYGGSSYGYGGLTPGGVQSAYDPMQYLTGMGTWFKDNFGSGSGTTNPPVATTATVNAT